MNTCEECGGKTQDKLAKLCDGCWERERRWNTDWAIAKLNREGFTVTTKDGFVVVPKKRTGAA